MLREARELQATRMPVPLNCIQLRLDTQVRNSMLRTSFACASPTHLNGAAYLSQLDYKSLLDGSDTGHKGRAHFGSLSGVPYLQNEGQKGMPAIGIFMVLFRGKVEGDLTGANGCILA